MFNRMSPTRNAGRRATKEPTLRELIEEPSFRKQVEDLMKADQKSKKSATPPLPTPRPAKRATTVSRKSKPTVRGK